MPKKISGGFVLAEFAIALPLLILLVWGLSNVSIQIFRLGRDQLADYVLETEAQYALEQITQKVRVAEKLEIKKFTPNIHQLKIIYHTVNESNELVTVKTDPSKIYYLFTLADVRETQYFIPHLDTDKNFYDTLNAKRKESGALTNPITGGNSFGKTKIHVLRYTFDAEKKILHITLELESTVTEHKIKLGTAVYMPNYGD